MYSLRQCVALRSRTSVCHDHAQTTSKFNSVSSYLLIAYRKIEERKNVWINEFGRECFEIRCSTYMYILFMRKMSCNFFVWLLLLCFIVVFTMQLALIREQNTDFCILYIYVMTSYIWCPYQRVLQKNHGWTSIRISDWSSWRVMGECTFGMRVRSDKGIVVWQSNINLMKVIF